ncbi:MAG: histidine phosphatase family protein [Dehalococcoidales bacterium]|nr:histidine phosphatase family protein [Dehalococcoidales bacterium]MDP7415461.1 histidine phosphatase family protein [Dehalococcoidales bacterium]
MTEIMLVRHGETEWNVGEVFRGRVDMELNETGTKQAEKLAEYLGNQRLKIIYSSPLQRALKTAEIIARQHKIEVTIAPGLIDFNYGQWQGLSHRKVKDRYKELYGEWINHPERVKIPDGENLEDVRQRTMAVVNDIITGHNGTVVLVSHRVVNKVLICALLGLDDSHFWKIKQDTGGLTIFTHENGRFVLTRHNDTSYLESADKTQLSDF